MRRSTSPRLHKGIPGPILLALMGATFLLQPSCAKLGLGPERIKSAVVSPGTWFGRTKSSAKEEPRVKPTAFRSQDYVVHVLKKGETPAGLAKRFLGDERKSWVIEEANEGVRFTKGQAVVIPLREENKGGLSRDGYQVVPILCYHHFAKACKTSLCIPVDIFDQQMKYLKENGYRVITLAELHDFLQYRHAIPKKAVVITIDDGYRSAYDFAFPILKKYGFTAGLFIYTDFVGVSSSAITWHQLRQMKAVGFEIGSHTLSHCDLTKRRKNERHQAYVKRIKRELGMSKKIIDERLEQDTIYLSFPYGNYDQRILGICERVGYEMGLTVKRGGNPFFADPLYLKRDQIFRRGMEKFASRLKTFQRFSLQ